MIYTNEKFLSTRKPLTQPKGLTFRSDVSCWFHLKVTYDSSVIRFPGTPIRVHTPVRQAD